MDITFLCHSPYKYSNTKHNAVFVRRASQIAPEQGEAANLPGSDSERGNQNDCQRAKQVPLNSGGGP